MKVHEFGSTATAYTESQTTDEIKDGDVLSVPSEGVVGVMVSAWPTAVTESTGEFHELASGYEWETFEGGRYAASAHVAALEVGWLERCAELEGRTPASPSAPSE